MFYCEDCRRRRKWPESISHSFGRCEICTRWERCWSRPSSTLPVPEWDTPEMREPTGE